VFAWLRLDSDRHFVLCVANFTPVIRYDYRLGIPLRDDYEERMNTDAALYGGSNTGNAGTIKSDAISSHGHPYSLSLTLPPLATLVLQPRQWVKQHDGD